MMKTMIAVVLLGACSGVGARCGADVEAQARLGRAVQDAAAAANRLAQRAPERSGEEILAAMKGDPDVGEIVAGIDGPYVLRVLARGGHAVVLVCCEDGSRALVEDSACTPALDRDESSRPRGACAFSIDPVGACAR